MGSRRDGKVSLIAPHPISVRAGWALPLSDDEKSSLRNTLGGILPGTREKHEEFCTRVSAYLAMKRGFAETRRDVMERHPSHDMDTKASRERIKAVVKAAGKLKDAVEKLDTYERNLIEIGLWEAAEDGLALGREYHARNSAISPLHWIHANPDLFPVWFDKNGKPLTYPSFDAIDRAASVSRLLSASTAFIPVPKSRPGQQISPGLKLLISQLALTYADIFGEQPSAKHAGVFCRAAEAILKYTNERLPNEVWLKAFLQKLELQSPKPKPGRKPQNHIGKN